MKKLFLVFCFSSAFAGSFNPESVSNVTQNQAFATEQLNNRYSKISWVDIIDTESIPEQSKELDIDEDLTSSNILIGLTNKTDNAITITGLTYLANGHTCGFTKANVIIKPKSTKRDYFMNKSEGVKCLKKVEENLNGRLGRLSLIDIGSKFDINKYQQFNSGLYLYPIRLIIVYNTNGTVSKRTELFYLIFATL